MTLAPASAVAFALSDGLPSDVREWLTVDLPASFDAGRRGIIVAVEPVTRTEAALALAARARELLVARLRERGAPDEVLTHAFAAANAALWEENGPNAGAPSEQHVLLGATALLIEGQTATVAFVPPGQTLIVQDGLVSAVPELASWLPTFTPASSLHMVEAMGYGPLVAPVLLRTELKPGDTVIVGTAGCGQALAAEIAAAGLGASDLSYLFGHDPDLVLDLFRGVFIRDGVDSAAVAVVGFPPLPSALQVRTLADVGRRLNERWRVGGANVRRWLPAPRQVGLPAAAMAGAGPLPGGYEMALAPARAERLTAAAGAMPIAAEQTAGGPAERRQGARNRFGNVSEWLSPKAAATWRPPSPVRQFGVPGAHGVHLYRGAATAMGQATWRHNLPRMPLVLTMLRWGVVALVLVTLLFGGVYARQRAAGESERLQTSIVEIDRHIVAARESSDQSAIVAELDQAQAALDVARDVGGADELAARQQEITRQRDELSKVIRFTSLTRVGSLPAELNADAAQLVMTEDGAYAAGGGLFELQLEARQIVRVLAPDQTIEDAAVGELFGAAVDVEGLYATDGLRLYRLGKDGTWTATTLGEVNGLSRWPAGPVGAFGGNFYLLAPSYGNIYKFPPPVEGASASVPVEWVEPSSRETLEGAVDFVIDGKIHVLLADGRVQTYYMGAVDDEIAFRLNGGVPQALSAGGVTDLLYMAVDDGESGRILCFDKGGTRAFQLMLPDGFSTGDPSIPSPFDNLRDIAVDEGAGTIYLITADAVWTAQFTLPSDLRGLGIGDRG